MAKAEFRDTINMIKESSRKDLIEKERIKELKLAQNNEVKRYINKQRLKRERVKQYLDEEHKELEAELDERL